MKMSGIRMVCVAVCCIGMACGGCKSDEESLKEAKEKKAAEKKAAAEKASEKKADKVDCEKLCTRAFKECIEEVLIVSGKLSAEKMKAFKSTPGALQKMKAAGYKACFSGCQKQGGIGSDAAAVNKCMPKKTCKEFAACVWPLIK